MRTLAKHSLALFVMLFAASCTVGPDYRPQQPEMPGQWTQPTTAPTSAPSTQNSVTIPDPTDLVQWWGVFEDPQLDSLIGRAIAANYDLKIATSRVREARASRGVVASALYPNVNTSAGYTRSGNSSVSGRDLYQAGLDAGWEIDIFGSVRRTVEAAEADIDVAVEERRDVLITLTAEIALDYFDLRSLEREMVIAKANLQSQQYSYDLAQRKYKAGFVSRLDAANAEAQVASTMSQIPLLESSERQTIYALSVLLGQQPAALIQELSMEDPPAPTIPPTVPIGLPSELLRRRPDIRRAEASIHAATARVGVATADLFPRFSLSGSFAMESNRAKTVFNWSNRFWSIGPSVSWPLFDAGRINSNIEVQKAATEQTILTYQQTVLNALRDTESALVAFAQEQRHREALQEAVAANRVAVNLSTTLYQQGQTDFINVLNAQRSLLASEVSLAQSDRTVATNLVTVFKNLGGGWERSEDSAPSTQP